MDTLRTLTQPQRAALTHLQEAAEAAPGDVPMWWRRQWAIGDASRTVLDALIRRGLAVQHMEFGALEWRITEKGRRLFAQVKA